MALNYVDLSTFRFFFPKIQLVHFICGFYIQIKPNNTCESKRLEDIESQQKVVGVLKLSMQIPREDSRRVNRVKVYIF